MNNLTRRTDRGKYAKDQRAGLLATEHQARINISEVLQRLDTICHYENYIVIYDLFENN
jgi:hypothetical protein